MLHPLVACSPKLAGTLFQKELGSLLDKSRRVEALVVPLADATGLAAQHPGEHTQCTCPMQMCCIQIVLWSSHVAWHSITLVSTHAVRTYYTAHFQRCASTSACM